MAYTAESVASYLKKMNKDYYGNRTWAKQFSNVDFLKQTAVEDLRSDFGTAVGNAYESALNNKTAIQMSNLISGNKQIALDENQLALEEAYDAFIKNYGSSYRDIEESTIAQMSEINNEALHQGEMFSRYATSHIDYLYDLWDKYQAGDISGDFFNDPKFSNYMISEYDDEGNLVLNESKPSKTIMDRSQLENLIFDENGNLTLAGRSFFEQMEYDELLRENSFSNYLSETDKELYDWARSNNPYDYAPNALGESTMAGTFNKMTGRESSDEVFTAADSFAGMTEGTISDLFGKTNAALENLTDALDSGEGVDKAQSEFSSEIVNLISTLGLDGSIMDELKSKGYDYNTIDEYINDVVNYYSNNTVDPTGQNIADIFGYTVSYAGTGAMAGSVVTPIGTAVGGLIGGIIGLGGGVIKSVMNTREAKKENQRVNEEVKNRYAELVSLLVNYASSEHDRIEKEFYDKETSMGATIQPYDPMTAKNSTYYDFGLKNGDMVRFLSSATLGKSSNVRNVDGDNFAIKYDGETFKLEVGNKIMDTKVSSQIKDKVHASMGRMPRTGDVFLYNGSLWVASEDGTIRNVIHRFASNDYDELVSKINSNI